MRYLAIDHGRKRTGLAVCDASQILITPHSVIETSSINELLDRISKVFNTEKIDAIVIGLPVNMDGTEGHRAISVRQFASLLRQRNTCPVFFQDERLSTFEAESLAVGLELTRKKKKKRLDAIAAAAILRAFLESEQMRHVKPHILKAADAETFADLAAACFCQAAWKAIELQDVFRVAVSGGSTPVRLYEKLAETKLPWEKVHIFWVDERYVRPDDPDSNFGLAMRTFLTKIALPNENIHPIWAEGKDEAEAATDYEQTIRLIFNLGTVQFPQFDLIVLGMGADGHIGSVFPDMYTLFDTESLVSAVKRPDYPRVTLTVPVIKNSRNILILVAGHGKADTLHQIFTTEPNPLCYPVQALWPVLNKITWIIDLPAASLLGPDVLE